MDLKAGGLLEVSFGLEDRPDCLLEVLAEPFVLLRLDEPLASESVCVEKESVPDEASV